MSSLLLTTLDTGNTAWMIMATILVLLMSIPGIALTEDYQTPNAVFFCLGVRLWVIRFIVKRATAQIVS